MIVFIYGTTAEAIKIAPVARRLTARGIPFEQWVTRQHTDALTAVIPQLGLPEPEVRIADGRNGRPLSSTKDVIPWAFSVLGWLRRNRKALRARLPENTVIVVHGDTMTTVLGAWIARRLRRPSAHIEAGLRSGNWRHPFPEELDRRIVGEIATIHYPPSDEAAQHLARKSNVVATPGNTVLDAVLDRIDDAPPAESDYGVVLLHRFEFVSNAEFAAETLRVLAAESPAPLRFFVDHFAERTLEDVLGHADPDRIMVSRKLPHAEFVQVLRNARFVVTDSGGIQAESALLGVPTLIHRKATEQHEGVGRNIVISGWDLDAVRDFLRDPERHRRPVAPPERSPSDVIVEDLIARGFAG